MILVDTSVWVEHLRRGDAQLVEMLERGNVLMHPFIACGSLADRPLIPDLLEHLPAAVLAGHEEVLRFIEHRRLYSKGIGYVDVHLLASTTLTAGARLWTHDKRLRVIADELGLALS